MRTKKASSNVVLAIMTSLFTLSACEETKNDWNTDPPPVYGQTPDSIMVVDDYVYHGFYNNNYIHWYCVREGFRGSYYQRYPYHFLHRTMVPVSTREHVRGFGSVGHGAPVRSAARTVAS